MIIVLSELKKLLPNLPDSGQKLADTFSLIGHFCGGYKKTDEEEVYDLEVRAANRPDCLGYLGLARDLSAYYGISLSQPKIVTPSNSEENNQRFNVQVEAKKYVKSLSASLITNLHILPSPPWLSKLLIHHNINPVNNLVDLTNYIMLLYGLPCHAFDAKAVNYSLNWTTSTKGNTITTFDGTSLNLPVDTLVIKSGQEVVSLSTIGGQKTGITDNSIDAILEVAVYDPTKVHQDAQTLNIQTEARSRLEKLLSPQDVKTALLHLQSLACTYCNAKITSHNFDCKNYTTDIKSIDFDPKLPSIYAGTNIPTHTALQILKNLGCQINQDHSITPPTWRTDINLSEDLIEEVIRIYGYNHIPTNSPIDQKKLTNITPINIYLSESVSNLLVKLGFDEIRSWPLIQEKYIFPKDGKNNSLKTENNINSEYPYLRQNIISSLIKQANTYARYCLPNPQFFEIGKIFSKTNSSYKENLALGIFSQDQLNLETTIQSIAKTLNLDIISPICIKYSDQNGYYVQIVLDGIKNFDQYHNSSTVTDAIELISQIQTLDATISFEQKQNIEELLNRYVGKIDKNILWSMVVKDYFFDKKTDKHNYTFTAHYYNCSSRLAKSIHLKAFGFKITTPNLVDPKG